MKPFDDIIRRILSEPSTALVVPAGEPIPLPELPPDLREMVDRLAEPAIYGDFHLPRPPAAYHPEAARCAAQMAGALRPAPRAVMTTWLDQLSQRVAPGAVTLEGVFEGLCDLCADLPVQCWTRETMAMVMRVHRKFLPSAGEIEEILRPVFRQLQRQLNVLQGSAEADPHGPRFRAGPVRPSTTRYDPGPAPDWTTSRKLCGRDDLSEIDAEKEDAKAAASVVEQLAKLGLAPPEAKP